MGVNANPSQCPLFALKNLPLHRGEEGHTLLFNMPPHFEIRDHDVQMLGANVAGPGQDPMSLDVTVGAANIV